MPPLVRFLLVHAAIGFVIAFVFVGGFLLADIGGMRTLMQASDVGLLALALFTFKTGLTFASVQMGVAVMLLGEPEDDGDGGLGLLKRVWHGVREWLAPPPLRATAPIKKNR